MVYFTSMINGSISVFLDQRCVGHIKTVEGGYQYFPARSKKGGEKILLRMCRCGHENADHKQVLDDGRPTSVFSCHGYGCVCGKFEEIDWDESDANHEEMMDYQRSITL